MRLGQPHEKTAGASMNREGFGRYSVQTVNPALRSSSAVSNKGNPITPV